MKKKHKWLIAIVSFLSLLPVAIFLAKFYDHRFSDDPANWGQLGDYLGGLLNPFISLLSLVVTIYIAVEVSKLDDTRNEKHFAFEKRRFINEIRESEYRRIAKSLQTFTDMIRQANQHQEEIHALAAEVTFFRTYNKHIFPFMDEAVPTELETAFREFAIFALRRGNAYTMQELPATEHVLKCLDLSVRFTNMIQEFIIKEI